MDYKKFDSKIELVMKKCRDLNGKDNKYWIVSEEVGRFLNFQVKIINAKKVLEIGTSIGYSTMFLAEGVRANGAHPANNEKVYTIESHAERFQIGKTHIQESGLSSYIEHLHTHAPEHIPPMIFDDKTSSHSGVSTHSPIPKNKVSTHLPAPLDNIDLLFIDATKYQYLEILEKIYPYLRKGALIIADNAISHGDAMQDYIKTTMDDPRFTSTLINIGTGLLLSKKL